MYIIIFWIKQKPVKFKDYKNFAFDSVVRDALKNLCNHILTSILQRGTDVGEKLKKKKK